MPIGHDCEYPTFEDCVRVNQDKDDPNAYCAKIQEETEEKCKRRSGLMGQKWTGTIAFEGEPTGDGRMLERGSLYWDTLPISLIWDRDEGDHSGAVLGNVSRIWRDGDAIMAEGELHDDSEDMATRRAVTRVMELLDDGAVGVSINLDSEEVEIRIRREDIDEIEEEVVAASAAPVKPDDVSDEEWAELQAMRVGLESETEEDGPEVDEDGREVVMKFKRDDELWVVTSARVRHLAIVDTAAFAGAKIALVSGPIENRMALPWHWEGAVIASTASLDVDAFRDPGFGINGDLDDRLVWQQPERPEERGTWGVPLTVTDDGRVYGHVALWNRCHAGFADRCVRPPVGGTYRRFMSASAVPGVRTGPITIGTTHAKLRMRPQEAMDHYSDTGRAVADVTVGEDRHGIWASGRLRPGVSEADVAALRGSALSGDWRQVGGALQLSGILAVNNPGFLVERAEALAASLITVGPCGCGSLAAQAGGFSGAVIAAIPTEADAQRLAQEGFEAEEDLHVTLVYMGPASDMDAVARESVLEEMEAVVESQPAFTANAFAYGVFNPGTDEVASVLLVQSEELIKLRGLTAEWNRSEHPGFFPHLTIGYNAEPGEIDLENLTGPVKFDRLRVAFADEVHEFQLTDQTSEELSSDGNDLAALLNRVALLELHVAEEMQRDVSRSGNGAKNGRVAAQATP